MFNLYKILQNFFFRFVKYVPAVGHLFKIKFSCHPV